MYKYLDTYELTTLKQDDIDSISPSSEIEAIVKRLSKNEMHTPGHIYC
jgi:hypothetical protein